MYICRWYHLDIDQLFQFSHRLQENLEIFLDRDFAVLLLLFSSWLRLLLFLTCLHPEFAEEAAKLLQGRPV